MLDLEVLARVKRQFKRNKKVAWGMAQVVDHLPSSPELKKKKKKKQYHQNK
jgi:hypothetical protein